jgi:hypothetical protein
LGGRGTILRAFFSSALWQIYEILYLFFRVQIYTFFSGGRNHSALYGGWDTHSSALKVSRLNIPVL